MENNWGEVSNFIHRLSGYPILKFLELFWIFFGTGNELDKISFFRLVLELLFNSEFLTINFLGYSI